MNFWVKNKFTGKVYYALLEEKTIKVLVDNDWIIFNIDALRVLFEIVDTDFYIERHPDCKVIIALAGSLAQIDIFGADYHKSTFCRRDEVTSVKADLIYMFRRNRH